MNVINNWDVYVGPANHHRIGDGSCVSDGDKVKTPWGLGSVAGVETCYSTVRIGVRLDHEHGMFDKAKPAFFMPVDLVKAPTEVARHV